MADSIPVYEGQHSLFYAPDAYGGYGRRLRTSGPATPRQFRYGHNVFPHNVTTRNRRSDERGDIVVDPLYHLACAQIGSGSASSLLFAMLKRAVTSDAPQNESN